MSNWQERIKQAFGARDNVEREQQERARRDREERHREERESELDQKSRLQEAREAFIRVGVREILESVKRDIWQVGEVTTKEMPDAILASLKWERKGTQQSRWADQGGTERVGPTYKGLWVDSLLIEVHAEYARVSGLHGFKSGPKLDSFSDQSYGFPERKLVSINSTDYPTGRSELEEAVLQFCEFRIKNKQLPRDLRN